MIYVVNLECPKGHPVVGEPREYAVFPPPDKWCDTISRDLIRKVRGADPPVCATCGAVYIHGRSNDWRVVVDEMKAKTMQEAHAALATAAEPFDCRSAGKP